MQGTPEHADLGKVVERYLYDPYGRVTVLHGDADADDPVTEWHEDTGGSDWANEILFAGYRYDAETGLYHVRNRMYHPTLGRWMQRDPLGYVDGLNLYEYCASGPADVSDPLGLAGLPKGVAQQLQRLASSYRGETAVAKAENARADRLDRQADALERRAGATDDKQEAKRLQNDADRVRGLAEEYRRSAGESLEAAKQIEQQAQQILDGVGPVGGRAAGGGGGDDEHEWYDKTWWDGNPFGDGLSWHATFWPELGKGVGTSLGNAAMDVAMPWRRVERAVANCEADVARGLSGFDAGLNAFGKNTPLVSAGWGLGEAIKGRAEGGVDHGRELNWGERGGRIGNFVAAEAMAGAWAAARWNSGPTYSPRVWEKTDTFHRFPQSFDKVIMEHGSKTIRGDYVLYEQPGCVNGILGNYQIGIENGVITHRFFNP